MKDLSAYYEIARLITAELSETITPEEKERLNVWLAEDERHYMRYCRIRERSDDLRFHFSGFIVILM